MSIARFEHISPAQYAADFAAWPGALPLEEIPLPKRATAGSAGYDLFCPIDAEIAPGTGLTFPLGIRCRIDEGWVLLVMPRSSMGFKYEVRLSNTVGVVDSDYYHADNEGHMKMRLFNGGSAPFVLRKGDRIGQGLFVPFGLAEEEEVTASRTGGFGSTGK